jgi:thioesterase domain-containing protein
MGQLLGPRQRVLAVQSPAIDDPGATTPSSIEAMADYYAAELDARLGGAECVLAGWSTGGYVAVELARRMSATVRGVVLLDPPPADARHGSAGDAGGTIDTFVRDLHRALFGPADAVRVDPGDEDATLARLLARMRAARLVPDGDDPAWLRRLYDVFRTNVHAGDRYRPEPLDREVTLVLARDRWLWPAGRVAASWRHALRSPVRLAEVAGDHYSMLRPPHVAGVVDVLREITRAPQASLEKVR